MTVHEIIGTIITLALLFGCGVALVGVLIIVISQVLSTSDKDLAVIGSQYVTDGKWDWTKGDLPMHQQGAPRCRVNIASYHNGDNKYDKSKGIVLPDDPILNEWQGVGYTEDKKDYFFTETDDTIPQEQAVKVELELTESDGDNRS